MNQISWKKFTLLLIAVEAFWFIVGTFIHEWTHNLSFFVLSGRFGEIHLLDSVAYSSNTIGICFPPQGLVISDSTYLELIAYGVQFLITGLVALFLYTKFYCACENKGEIQW
jgi:hypothetical protein